ncbi:MAG: 50S ribosomal protein L9 [Clostridia bacterium]
MKVVLNQDVKGIGKIHQIVQVSEGYARNFLLPKKLATIADNKNINEANTKSEAIKFKKNTELTMAEELKNKIEKSYIEFRHKIGEGGKLFGSVTEKEIADELNKKHGTDINKKKISLNTAIKNVGSYTVKVKIYEGVVANLKVVVVGM